MYLEYYGLKEPPFDLTPNPRFLFFSANHREAFNHLVYGIRERKGFVQLTGEAGAGKTTVCRAMLETLGESWASSFIFNPPADPDLLLKAFATVSKSLPQAQLQLLLHESHRDALPQHFQGVAAAASQALPRDRKKTQSEFRTALQAV